jgi:hypothetical protein
LGLAWLGIVQDSKKIIVDPRKFMISVALSSFDRVGIGGFKTWCKSKTSFCGNLRYVCTDKFNFFIADHKARVPGKAPKMIPGREFHGFDWSMT